jgi:hypothetical protein
VDLAAEEHFLLAGVPERVVGAGVFELLEGVDVVAVVGGVFADGERRDFWEICEDRYQVRSMILTSQMPVSKWHEQIGDPTVADGILDRIVHNAHRIEMRGDSMRKKRKGEEPAGKDPAGGAQR